MIKNVCVFQDWMLDLNMQQSVLILACRGPDGVAKFHPSKLIVARYRATVLKAAYLGRPMNINEGDATTFMTLHGFGFEREWGAMEDAFFNHVDELPHHYYMHLAHGAQIAGYKHPDALFQDRWKSFYRRCCHDLHMWPESEQEMDQRLCDWHQEHWDSPEQAISYAQVLADIACLKNL